MKIVRPRPPWRGAASQTILKRFDHDVQPQVPDKVDTDLSVEQLTECGAELNHGNTAGLANTRRQTAPATLIGRRTKEVPP